jgi:drug/metabolite transporter superfamily protein YnfA
MSYLDTIQNHATNPEQLELAYHDARKAGESTAFQAAIDAGYAGAPDNLLYAAWHYRLVYAAKEAGGRVIAWMPALLLALLNGLILWGLSDPEIALHVKINTEIPYFVLLWAPITASLAMLFFATVRKAGWLRVCSLIVVAGALALYPVLFYDHIDLPVFQEQYLILMALHIPLLSWLIVGIDLLWRTPDAENRFAFLIKSLEVFVTGGLFAIALAVLTAITLGMFDALGITPPDTVARLFWAGGGGMIPLLAIALIYAPDRSPAHQSFDEGLSKLIGTLMRVLLAPTLLVLVVYLGFIPSNFFAPLENRDVLIVFNAMLFAVIALLLGATPVHDVDLSISVRLWLRRGLIAVALLAVLVGVYALAAITYRTVIDRLTPNRLAFIGWNVVNISLLLFLLVKQMRANHGSWLAALHSAFSAGLLAYALWGLFIVVSIPWMFTVDLRDVEHLPAEVQRYVYEQPALILLKCPSSPHIYALEDGAKRWIKDIATFEQRGYRWSDVNFVSCSALRDTPDGPSIPPDAGPPPQP